MVAMLTHALAKTRCGAFATDLRLFVKREQLYTYPDLMVICGRLIFAPGRMDTVTNPVIIGEVLSPSTESYDRGKKFEFYRTLETMQEYLLIDQERFYVEHYQRSQSASCMIFRPLCFLRVLRGFVFLLLGISKAVGLFFFGLHDLRHDADGGLAQGGDMIEGGQAQPVGLQHAFVRGQEA